MFSSLIPTIDSFSDEQIAELAAKFLQRELPEMQALVQSPPGQHVLGVLRGIVKEGEEPPEIFHRCPACGFAHTLELN